MILPGYVNTFGHAMLHRYGERVHKIAIDADFTCPNRDGSKGRGGCTFCNNVSFSPNGRQPAGIIEQIAVVSIKKAYPGHARRIMFGVWSYLRQFVYTKFVIVTDDDINVRNWSEVIWAISTRMDPVRDSVLVENTSIDYLDFASPVSGLGSKMGFDASNKWPAETSRLRSRPISMSDEVTQRVDTLWNQLGIT